MLYFSMLFDPYSTNIKIIKFPWEQFLCKTSLTGKADWMATFCISIFKHLIRIIKKQNISQDAAKVTGWKVLKEFFLPS